MSAQNVRFSTAFIYNARINGPDFFFSICGNPYILFATGLKTGNFWSIFYYFIFRPVRV